MHDGKTVKESDCNKRKMRGRSFSSMTTDEIGNLPKNKTALGHQQSSDKSAAHQQIKDLYARRAQTSGHGKRAKITARIDALKKQHGIKEDGEDMIVEGYGSVFNNIDSDNDKIVPGAFQRSLKKRKLR